MKTHKISSAHITPQQAYEIARGGYRLELSDDARTRIQRCRDYLDSKTEEKDAAPIYGVTTGFGSLCNISVDKKRLGELQKNLVMSHACGTGERVPSEIVRLILLLKIQSLSYGHSGVQVATVERLIDFFNNGVLPVIYQQGSLGASGDLAPLAHMSLPLLGLGEVEFEGKDVPASEVLKKFGWEPIELQSKEGLALLNGTQFMSAFGVWCVVNARRLSECADKIGAMSLDAFDGRIEPFYEPGSQGTRPPRPARNGTRLPRAAQGQRADSTPQGARSRPLLLPLHPAGTRRIERYHRLRGERHHHGNQQRDGQPHGIPRRGHRHLGRQLPRPADSRGDGFPSPSRYPSWATSPNAAPTSSSPVRAGCPRSSWPIRASTAVS